MIFVKNQNIHIYWTFCSKYRDERYFFLLRCAVLKVFKLLEMGDLRNPAGVSFWFFFVILVLLAIRFQLHTTDFSYFYAPSALAAQIKKNDRATSQLIETFLKWNRENKTFKLAQNRKFSSKKWGIVRKFGEKTTTITINIHCQCADKRYYFGFLYKQKKLTLSHLLWMGPPNLFRILFLYHYFEVVSLSFYF